MERPQIQPSAMLETVRTLARQVQFADMQGSLLTSKSQEAGQRDDFASMNAFADQADVSWTAMERDLNVLIPLLVSPEMDQTGAMSPANSFLSFNKGSGIWEINTYCIPVTTGAGALTVMVRLFDGTSPTFNGDVAKGVYVDCIQVEFAQSYSSFIPTTTAAVTRNADDHDLVFSTDDFNPALFSVYCEARYNGGGAFNSGNRYAFAIDNNTANNLVGFCNDTGKAHGMRIIRTGTTELAVPGNSPSNFDLIPAAARIIAGDIAISNDGVNVVTSAITNVPQFALLAPRLKLGRNSAGNYLNGHVREVMLFSGEALTNAQLIALAA